MRSSATSGWVRAQSTTWSRVRNAARSVSLTAKPPSSLS